MPQILQSQWHEKTADPGRMPLLWCLVALDALEPLSVLSLGDRVSASTDREIQNRSLVFLIDCGEPTTHMPGSPKS